MAARERADAPELPHPSAGLNEVVHQRTRLGILTVLAESHRADFTYLKSTLGLSDGNLGRHLEILADEGLIEITKGYEGRRPRTWAEITSAGQSALAAQMAAMKKLVSQYEASTVITQNTKSSPTKGGSLRTADRDKATPRRAMPRLSGT